MGFYVKHDFKMPIAKCYRCEYIWTPRKAKIDACPKCKSRYWNRERKRSVKVPAKRFDERGQPQQIEQVDQSN
jgi:Zn finger protein HypA/HybF involved in hydrogenase expression